MIDLAEHLFQTGVAMNRIALASMGLEELGGFRVFDPDEDEEGDLFWEDEEDEDEDWEEEDFWDDEDDFEEEDG